MRGEGERAHTELRCPFLLHTNSTHLLQNFSKDAILNSVVAMKR